VNDQVIQYAPGDLTPVHSRAGVIGFTCAALSIGGILITMLLIARPMGGPVGGLVRGLAPVFGVGVFLLWLAGVTLGTIGLRQRRHVRTFARAALATCAVTVALFVLMILLMY
jgi:hypothetical protein